MSASSTASWLTSCAKQGTAATRSATRMKMYFIIGSLRAELKQHLYCICIVRIDFERALVVRDCLLLVASFLVRLTETVVHVRRIRICVDVDREDCNSLGNFLLLREIVVTDAIEIRLANEKSLEVCLLQSLVNLLRLLGTLTVDCRDQHVADRFGFQIEQLDIEDELRVRRDTIAGAFRAVSHLRWDNERCFVADAKHRNSFIPSLDNLSLAESKRKRFALDRAVENL